MNIFCNIMSNFESLLVKSEQLVEQRSTLSNQVEKPSIHHAKSIKGATRCNEKREPHA